MGGAGLRGGRGHLHHLATLGAGVNRREVLAALAVAPIVRWSGQQVPVRAPERVRCGTAITLEHPEADAFELRSVGRPTVQVPARGGRLVFRAPIAALPGFVDVECTPVLKGRPIGAPVAVPVYTPKLSWGA
jgi:hypothetical protein